MTVALDAETAEKLHAVRLARADFPRYCEHFLRIRTDRGTLAPLMLNQAQRYIHARAEEQKRQTGKVRMLILKARQWGCSTYVGARYYYAATGGLGKRVFILTHLDDATKNLFRMTKRFHQMIDPRLKPHTQASNARELIFDRLESSYAVATAGSKEVGRSDTVQYLHGSEAAYWPHAHEHAAGVLQTVPRVAGSEVFLESTSAGPMGWFYEQCQLARAGASEYQFCFVPWFWVEKYTVAAPAGFSLNAEDADYQRRHDLSASQMAWRALKINEFGGDEDARIRFMREYPATADEAFRSADTDSLIKADVVLRARRAEGIMPVGPLVFGVDVAWDGKSSKDRSVVVARQGRVATLLGSWRNLSTMELAGRVARLIDTHSPAQTFIDAVGLGAGVYDRLRELGYAVRAVHGAETPIEQELYLNKRAECWGEMKRWLEESPQVSIPDDDALQADLVSLNSRRDSRYRLVIESKEQLAKRSLPSPDCFVAGTGVRTPRGVRAIETLRVGDQVSTPFGPRRIVKVWESQTNRLTTARFSNGSELTGKGGHKVFTWDRGWVRLDALSLANEVEIANAWRLMAWRIRNLLCTKEKHSGFKAMVDIINPGARKRRSDFYTGGFGSSITDRFRLDFTSIIAMAIGVITRCRISSWWRAENILAPTSAPTIKHQRAGVRHCLGLSARARQPLSGIAPRRGENGTAYMASKRGRTESKPSADAVSAEKVSRAGFQLGQGFARTHASNARVINGIKRRLATVGGVAKSLGTTNTGSRHVVPVYVQTVCAQHVGVYNLTLDHDNVYYANDVLVANCADALGLTFSYPVAAALIARAMNPRRPINWRAV